MIMYGVLVRSNPDLTVPPLPAVHDALLAVSSEGVAPDIPAIPAMPDGGRVHPRLRNFDPSEVPKMSWREHRLSARRRSRQLPYGMKCGSAAEFG
jgi:hypothetical protein